MKRLYLALAFVWIATGHAQNAPPEVLLFGVFHFANPGRDVVRVDQIDVTTPANQAYLAQLADRLCAFRPTVILLELDRAREPDIREQLEAYREGRAALSSNENHQIGLRTAKACDVAEIRGFDESEVGWNPEPLFAYLDESAPDLRRTFDEAIAEIQAQETAAHRDLGLSELLIRANDPEQDRLNKNLYLLTNGAGAGEGFEGADATARWWHRNFRMYANLQRYAKPGQRLLVVAGQGHAAILRDLLEIDSGVVSRDVRPYL